MALPNLKIKTFQSSTPKCHHRNQKSSPNPTNPFNMQAGIEILEGMDLIKYAKLKGEALNAQLSKEIVRLEKDLDCSEISMIGATINCEQEFRIYKQFSEKLVYIASKKDKRLSTVLLRGLTGCDKAFKKLNTQIRAEIPDYYSIKPVAIAEISTQTDFIEKYEEFTKALIVPDMESFRCLPEAVDKIQVSRISNKLSQLYESLNALYMDIPSPSDSPEPMLPNFIEKDKIVNLKFTVIRQSINKLLQSASEVRKVGIPKESQTDFDSRRNAVFVLEGMNEEKELDLLRLRSRFQTLCREKALVDERLMRANHVIEDYEKKYTPFEIELARCKQENSILTERMLHFQKKFEVSDGGLDESRSKNYKMRKMIEGLKQMLRRKQAQLQESSDHLYNTQVIWRIAETKLRNIEKKWEKTTGTLFEYKDINIEKITQKFALKKIEVPSYEEEIKTLEAAGYSDHFDLAAALDSDSQDELEQVLVSGNAEKRKKKYLKVSNGRKKKLCAKKPSGRNEGDKNQGGNGSDNEQQRKYILEEDSSYESLLENSENSSAHSSSKSITINIPAKSDNDDVVNKYLRVSDKKSGKKPPSRSVTPMKSQRGGVKGSVKRHERTVSDIATEKKAVQGKTNKNTSRKNPNAVTSTGTSHEQDKNSLTKHNTTNLDPKPKRNASHAETCYDISVNYPKSDEYEQTAHQDKNTIVNISHQKKSRVGGEHGNKISSEDRHEESQLNHYENEKLGNGSNRDHKPHGKNHYQEPGKARKMRDESQDMLDENILKPIQIKFTFDSHSQYDEDADADSFSNENSHNKRRSPSHAVLSTNKEKDLLNPKKKSQICLSATSNQPSLTSLFGEDHYKRRRLTQRLTNEEESKEVEILLTAIQDSKNFLSSILTSEQRKIFEEITAKEEELKIMKSLNCSKAIQCMLILSDKFDDKLERIRKKDKYKKLLRKVFEFPAEIDMLIPQFRRELALALKGHKNNKCSEHCEHLRRALQIKLKSRGTPYPIKTIKM